MDSVPTPVPPAPDTTEPTVPPKKSWGAVFSILAMLFLIVFAALYTWGERVSEEGGIVPSEQQ